MSKYFILVPYTIESKGLNLTDNYMMIGSKLLILTRTRINIVLIISIFITLNIHSQYNLLSIRVFIFMVYMVVETL